MDIKNSHDFAYLVTGLVFLSCVKAIFAGHWWGRRNRRLNSGPLIFITFVGTATSLGISIAYASLLWLAGEPWLIVCPLAIFALTARYQRRKHPSNA